MDNKNSHKTESNSQPEMINIHDCLKMIGMKEVAAHIYAMPSKKPTRSKA